MSGFAHLYPTDGCHVPVLISMNKKFVMDGLQGWPLLLRSAADSACRLTTILSCRYPFLSTSIYVGTCTVIIHFVSSGACCECTSRATLTVDLLEYIFWVYVCNIPMLYDIHICTLRKYRRIYCRCSSLY